MDKSAQNRSSNQCNSSLNPSENIDEHSKQSSLEEDSVKNFGTRPPTIFLVAPIAQNIVILKTNSHSEKRPNHIWKSCRQHDSYYYQPQPAVQNHRQWYHHDRRIQQASLKK